MLVMDRLAREHKDFEEAVLRYQDTNLESRELKSNISVGACKRQTVFVEEVEDEYWKEYRAKDKSSVHLLHQEGDEDNLEQQKEAFMSSKEKVPESESINPRNSWTEEPTNSFQSEIPSSAYGSTPLAGDRLAEVKTLL